MSDQAILPVAAVRIGHPNQLESTAADYAAAGMAANTRRAFSGAFRGFSTWCASVGLQPLPADPDTVAKYLAARAPTLAASTLALHLAAIKAAHRHHDLPPPDSAWLRQVWNGIRSQHGRPPDKKRALLLQDLRKGLRRLPTTLQGDRDRALLLVQFAGALRRSEIAALAVDRTSPVRVVFVSDGMELLISRSKGDQYGHGAVLAIPFGARAETCPVGALRTWLERAGVRAGYVFRGVRGDRCLDDGPISDKTVARLVKAAAKRAGLDPAHFSGHSMRRGAITQAVRGGASPTAVQDLARHSRFDVTKGYIEDAERFDTTATRKMGL